MACYHPLKAFPVGFHDSGKTKYHIAPYTTHHVEKRADGSVVNVPGSTLSMYSKNVIRDYVEIPCGRCIGCRLAYSRQWADRCMLELKYHPQSWFVTLTYDNEHLPLNEVVDMETGEIVSNATLCKRDFQLFMKRLRKNYKYDNHLKYFCAGEYGSQTYRPHYHAIIFGLQLDDLQLYKMAEDGYSYYNSEFLSKCWNKGHVVVGKCNWDTCAYTARYIMKKQYGSAAEIYERYNIVPEFTLMSRKPAIGLQYYEDNKDTIFDSDFIYVGTEEGSHAIRPPRYYERKFEIDFPEDYAILKEQRKEFCEDMKLLKQESTSLPYLQMLETEELVKQAQISALKRKEF